MLNTEIDLITSMLPFRVNVSMKERHVRLPQPKIHMSFNKPIMIPGVREMRQVELYPGELSSIKRLD
ncbi:hypothetical protein DNK31_25035 [Phytopseudomonas daroniae]|nr:hypothetical protein DNK31_25035 [Pseudomonas sp. FRB 228]